MAKKVLEPVQAGYNAITKVSFEEATSASDGFEVKFKGTDEYGFILVNNSGSAAKKITLKAPTKKSYAAASSDKELSLEAGASAVIRIESARYANTDGTVVLIPETTDVKVVAVM